MFKKILIATDGSEYVKKAIIFGIELAKLCGSELHGIYIISLVSPLIDLDIAEDYKTEDLKILLRQEGFIALKYIDDLAKSEGIILNKWIIDGFPANEILKLAEDQSVDLIVMGTFGRSGIEKFLLGSVAEKVIRGSKIPVLIVRNNRPSEVL